MNLFFSSVLCCVWFDNVNIDCFILQQEKLQKKKKRKKGQTLSFCVLFEVYLCHLFKCVKTPKSNIYFCFLTERGRVKETEKQTKKVNHNHLIELTYKSIKWSAVGNFSMNEINVKGKERQAAAAVKLITAITPNLFSFFYQFRWVIIKFNLKFLIFFLSF